MKITFLSIGRISGTVFQNAFDQYKSRLSFTIQNKELALKKQLPPSQQSKAETDLLEKNISKNSLLIALDSTGKTLDSVEFSQKFEEWLEHSKQEITFIIGGSEGLHPTILKKANFILSLSKMTWPHMLARVMLIEQIYRAQCILKNHPYHK